jgi:hypothetical protein
MFCATGLVFGGTEGVGSRFHVLRVRTHFRRYRGRRVPFFMFCAPGLVFSAVPRVSGPVFMFCVPRLIFGDTEGVGSRFHVSCAHTRFLRYRWHRVPFSCFARPAHVLRRVPFSCFAPGIVFDGTEGVWSRFHILRARTRFLRYRGHLVQFSCFARPDSFSAVPRASGPFFMFCVPGLIFNGVECVRSGFHVLSSCSRFQRYRGCGVPFSCFACPNSFSAVPRASGPVFMFCAPPLVF